MMQHASLRADRPVADHSAELRVKRAATLATFTERMEELGILLAERLKEELSLLPGTAVLQVRSTGVAMVQNPQLVETIGPLAANAVYAVTGTAHCCVVSASARAVLAHLDRSFGGRGDGTDPLPEVLPTSASFLAKGLEKALAQGFTRSFEDLCGRVLELDSLSRGGRIAALTPYTPMDDLAVLTLVFTEDGSPPWHAQFVLPAASLPQLFAHTAGAPALASERTAPVHSGPASPLAAPFCDIPLPVEARLVDMILPLSRLSQLAPGYVLPIAIARQVPLRVGGRIIARGTVGEMDDTIALQITQLL